MPNSVSIPISGLLAALAFGVILGGAVLLARLASRRERRSRRVAGLKLRRALRRAMHEHFEAEALREIANVCDRESFWSALETCARIARLPRAAARALSSVEHVADERRALRDDSPWRRELAARRLGLVPSPRTRASLRRAMVRGPELVTYAAALSLARQRDGSALRWLLTHPERIAKRTARARLALLRAFGSGARERLIAALNAGTGDPALERAMLDTFEGESARGALAAIQRRLTHADPELRAASARALGRIRVPEAAGALIAALEDTEWPVRAQAARSLGQIGDAHCASALAACLTDRAWWVRRHAAYALAALGAEGRAALERAAAGSPDRYAREMADEALSESRRHAAGS